eukprot:TRINITY_DN109805_c0_g1_i1.p1 TRINITY_DN109805_c0_g1~~TRINITY_DN109805_c0_g1_i1.p1  ORF type:complete len:360 (-),score=75.63 TRINITY_DN109805_c0_g1_i1:15-1073(-)
MAEQRPLVLCDCPFFEEFQQLFDTHVRIVFVTEHVQKKIDEVQESDVLSTISAVAAQGEIAAVISHQHVAFGANIFEMLPKLKVVSNHGVGYGHIDAAYLRKRGIPLGYTPGAASGPTAELGAALILASARNVLPSVQRACAPDTVSFDPYWYGQRVAGATLGIVGLGDMGQALSRCMRGFDMDVLYWNRARKEPLEAALGVSWCAGGLNELLERSDFVVLCVASSPTTRGMIGAEQLAKMKRTATLVNIARGDIVVQEDLVQALHVGTIAAAALDVTTPEPLPRDHPLLHMHNVIVTSHIGSATKSDRRRMAEMCLENLLAGLQSLPLPHPVHQADAGNAVKRRADGGTVQ